MHVPRGQIGPCAFTEIFVCDPGGTARRWSQRRLLAATGLNTAFSSAEMTNSRAFRGRPCQTRSYKSRIRPALAAKSGSRGKIQLRCRQGRSASALSQRHKVAPLMAATNPCVITSRRISERESRESGSCKRCGSSHASALTWTTTLGGKEGGTPAPRLRLQARKPREGESLAPLTHNLARCVQASSDDVVGEAFRRE
jgi:hypothetical protein